MVNEFNSKRMTINAHSQCQVYDMIQMTINQCDAAGFNTIFVNNVLSHINDQLLFRYMRDLTRWLQGDEANRQKARLIIKEPLWTKSIKASVPIKNWNF